MNKFLQKLAKLTLGLAMAAGVGVAVGPASNGAASVNAATSTLTISDISDWGSNNYNSGNVRSATVGSLELHSHYVTRNPVNAPVKGDAANQYIQFRGSDATVYNIAAAGTKITSVVLTLVSNTNTGFILYCGTEQLFSDTNTSRSQTPSGTGLNPSISNNVLTWDLSSNSYTFFCLKKGSNAGYGISLSINYSTDGPAPTTYKVTYNENKPDGASGTVDNMPETNPVTGITSGTEYTLSSSLPTLTGFTCLGWGETSSATSADLVTKITVDGNKNVYAVWQESSTPAGQTITFDATKDTGTSPLSKTGVSFACSNGVLNNSSEYRLYKNSKTTFSHATLNILKIQFTGVSGNPASGFATQTGWSTSGNDGTWTGEAKSVSFTASGAQVRATKIDITLEAVTYTVTYNGNGNTGGSVPEDATKYEDGGTVTVKGNTGSLVKTNYQFAGWNTKADGSGTTYAAGSGSFSITENTTLYAKWILNTYTVSFVIAEGKTGYGSLSANSIANVPHGSLISTSSNTITINGTTITATPNSATEQYVYTFDGWANNTGTVTAARTITASFERSLQSYSVGGTIQDGYLSSTANVEYGSSLEITIEPTNTSTHTHPDSIQSVTMGGDSYNGYEYTSSTGRFYIASVTGAVVINASCKAIVPSVVITYDVAGGSSVDNESVLQGGHPTFPDTEKSGFNFKGWKTDGDNTLYTSANKESYTVSTPVTFVAQWAAIYTVSYSTEVSSVDPTSEPIEVNGHPSFPTPTEPAHFTFNGWQVNGTGTIYTNPNDYTVIGNVSFVAKWTEDSKVTVTYNANSGTVSPTSELVYTGEKPSLPTPTRSGYAFDGWQINGEGAYVTSAYTVGSTNVELVAHWSQIVEVTDTLNRALTGVTSGSTNYTDWSGKTSNSNAVYAGQSAGGNDSIQIRSKNANSGIITTASGGKLKSVSVVFESNTQNDNTVNVYGKNEAYEAPTDLFDSENQGTLLGTIVKGTSTSLSISGDYTFVGLCSDSGAIYLTSVTIVWEGAAAPVSTFTVSYDANEGTGSAPAEPTSYNSGATVTVLENTFTREGYSFVNWNTAANGGGQSYEEGGTFEISENTTLYAQWEEDSGGGGSGVAKRCYSLVTSTDELAVGAKYIITNELQEESLYALSTNQKSSNRGDTEISGSGTVATVQSSNVEIITLSQTSGYWNLGVADGFLYAASSTANQLKTEADVDDEGNANWAISFSDGVASIIAQGTNSRNVMQYNAGSNLFACYSSASQSDIYLYRLDFEETLLANVTCSGSGTHSLPQGYSWNVDLLAVYNALPDVEKAALVTKQAAVNSGLERYDYIISKYNHGGNNSGLTNYNHFIVGRSIRSSQASLLLTAALGENTNTIAIMVIISVVSVGAIGGYFFIRKRKEN